jgi:hypothetical protein
MSASYAICSICVSVGGGDKAKSVPAEKKSSTICFYAVFLRGTKNWEKFIFGELIPR